MSRRSRRREEENEEAASESQEEVQESGEVSSDEQMRESGAPEGVESSPEEGEELQADRSPLEEGALGGNTSEENGPTSEEETSEALDEEPEPEVLQEEDVIQQMESTEGDTLSDVEGEPFGEGPMPSRRVAPTPPEEVIGTLRRLREDVGQISELGSEEGNIVDAFSFAFLKIMETLAKTLPVDVSILPRRMGAIDRANVVPEAELVALYRDGRMESFDLKEPENRDLLVDIVSNVMPKLNSLVAQKRAEMERRISFLSDVTKELQTIADSLAFIG